MALMSHGYGALLRLPGARQFAIAGLVARIPMSTLSLSLILMVQLQYNRWEVAGRVAAVGTLVWAAQTIPAARFIDKHGQRWMWPFAVALVSGVTLTVWTSTTQGPEWLLMLGAAIGSLSGPMGSLTRARWSYLLRDNDAAVHTAFSLEGALDEVLFVGGPALVTVLAYTVHPASGLILAAVGGTAGLLWLISQRDTEPPARGADGGAGLGLAVPASVIATGVISVALGLLFGALDVTSVAFAADAGHRAWGGVIVGIVSAGSFVGGLTYGARRWKAPLFKLTIGTSVALGIGMIAASLAPSLITFAALGAVAGLAIGPALTATSSVVQRVVEQTHLTEGLAWISIGMGMGVAAGAWLAGRFIDAHGHTGGQAVIGASGAALIVLALATSPWVRRDTAKPTD